MSLQNQPPIKQFPVGIISAKNLDDPDYLEKIIGPHIAQISHIYTNSANRLVLDFGFANGIPVTAFPITGERNLLWSIARIAENSKFVYIVATADSKSAQHAKEILDQKSIKYKLFEYEPCNHWKEKVCKIEEVISALAPEDVEKNQFYKAIRNLL